MSDTTPQPVSNGYRKYVKSKIKFNTFNTFNNVATTQTKLVGFCLGDKTNYSATTYANHIWFDPNNKQILLNGIEYIPKKLSELVNDKNFLTSITKAMVEGVLTGNITSHTHTFASLTDKPTTISGYGITDGLRRVTLANNVENDFNTFENLTLTGRGDPTTGSSILNSPWTTQPAGGFGVLTYLWSGYGLQLAAGYHSNDLYIRNKYYTNGGANWGTRWDKILNSSNFNSYALPLTGGTLSGALTCNGDYINMNNDSGSRGYRGFFNQSNSTSRASGSHIFMYGGGEALGTNSVSIGYQAYAGIRNKDSDATTYPYIAWQWMPTEKFMVDTTNSATLSGGEYYGFPLLPNEMVQWNIGGQNVTYENSSSYKELLVVIKASDADTGLVFGGKTTLPYRASKTLIAGKYIVGSGEYLKNITEITINNVKYYQVIIYTWDTTASPTYYDFTQQVKVMCATKVSNSNYSGAASYASGNYSVASGNSSVASGYSSVASGYSSVASGYYSVASGNFSVVLARNGETMSSYQTIVGKFNAKVAGLFIIGNGTSNTARSNAFVVDDSGNVTAKYFSGYANAIGGEGFKIYAENNNQINFGGTASDTTIVFGAASKDNRNVPTTYKFGADGTATIQAAAFTGNASTSTKSEYSRSLLGRNTSGNDYPAISANLVFAEWNTMNDNRWYLKANGYECRVAYATSATKLGASSVGSATHPIYLNGGTPTACSYTLAKSVPSNAVFTDTTYSVATASADGLMSAAMFKAQMVKSVGVQQGAEMVKPDGTITITDHSVYVTQDKSNITGVYQTASGENDVKIPNATKDYDGSMSYTDKRKLDKMPPTMFGAQLIFYNNEILVDGIYGDYNIGSGDATVDSYETIQENNHYITMVMFNITNNDLIDKLRNGYVKFGYSSKDNATYETMRLLQSNFDGSGLFVEFIHATPIGNKSFLFDCIWDVYPI